MLLTDELAYYDSAVHRFKHYTTRTPPETIEKMKEVVMKVIDTLTQEDFHGPFQKLLERYKCIAARRDYFEGD